MVPLVRVIYFISGSVPPPLCKCPGRRNERVRKQKRRSHGQPGVPEFNILDRGVEHFQATKK